MNETNIKVCCLRNSDKLYFRGLYRYQISFLKRLGLTDQKQRWSASKVNVVSNMVHVTSYIHYKLTIDTKQLLHYRVPWITVTPLGGHLLLRPCLHWSSDINAAMSLAILPWLKLLRFLINLGSHFKNGLQPPIDQIWHKHWRWLLHISHRRLV